MSTPAAGEHHTGNLNLTGQGNPEQAPISDEAIRAACGAWAVTPTYGTAAGLRDAMSAALEAAYPAIRQHVAEQIAAALEVRRAEITPGRPGWNYLTEAIDKTREIGGGQ